MNNFYLLACFAGLLALGVSLLLYPLRQAKHWIFFLITLIGTGVSLAYQHWGGWKVWQHSNQQRIAHQQLQKVLTSPKDTDDLIRRFKKRLKDRPTNARGWYLLGRVYASQGQWTKAEEVYKKAHQLNPEDETFEVNYVQSRWETNHQQCNEEIRALFKQLLERNPNQADSLAILAIDAYQKEDYKTALSYWERLRQLLPNSSEEADVISQAIFETKKHLRAEL